MLEHHGAEVARLSTLALVLLAMSSLVRMPSNKLPKGRHLIGESVVYDIDVRFPGEFQPQLEVTHITKYGSDPQLVLGRQIAVNKSYICYGLKQGNIRVLNMHTALRSLFRAHTQRVTDMAFFAKDVHLLASVSVEGRLFVWKISEGPDEEGTPQITEEDYEYKKEVARLSTLALVLLAMSSKPTLEARFSSSCLPSQFDSDGLGTRFGELGAARGTTWGRLIWSPSAVVE